ncbi:MAG: hypothetical protein M5T52_02445 [Ignavibacteriaceae bacterium]|nr:hypothetical protein [Ignavibacteriaceae bacterium]
MFFNPVEVSKIKASQYSEEYSRLEDEYVKVNEEKQKAATKIISMIDSDDKTSLQAQNQLLLEKQKEADEIKKSAVEIIKKSDPMAEANDTNYIFISFIINFLPIGFVGLLIAAILSASMSSTSAELNALASTTVIDFYKRLVRKEADDKQYLKISKIATVFWGIYAILFAVLVKELGSLVEAVNILGSLVYGTILGIFLTAFYLKKVSGTLDISRSSNGRTGRDLLLLVYGYSISMV